MRRVSCLGILFLPLFIFAQNGPASSQQVRQELVDIERKIGQANLDCDYKYFQQIEADDFLFTDASGGTSTKADDLAGEKNCHKFAGTYDLDQTEVRAYGEVAIVTARVTIKGTNREGKPVHRVSRFTDVFLWKDGRWQIVAGHSSRVPKTAK